MQPLVLPDEGLFPFGAAAPSEGLTETLRIRMERVWLLRRLVGPFGFS